MNKKYTGLMWLWRATVYSVQGLYATWRHEAAFRQEVTGCSCHCRRLLAGCWRHQPAIAYSSRHIGGRGGTA
ncbi:putative diacylglycerol kinase [Sodalis glossinidius str. 'morsitans']|uniref:Diacylglycerol kinase n=1 Tax=Sodalis glossinidius (strain morsitans) TaxID=343509 RepID=Q2NWA5_SODGM|nr:putative diacylglycerol kinase [Sodalis glossinidius str. 'morsitans']